MKELIPEFYGDDESFLVNKLGVNLGTKQNGEVIGDVHLPKWANNDPKVFLSKMREGMMV